MKLADVEKRGVVERVVVEANNAVRCEVMKVNPSKFVDKAQRVGLAPYLQTSRPRRVEQRTPQLR